MKPLILILLLLSSSLFAVEIESPNNEPRDLVEELYQLKEQMDDLTDQLRDDEHHDGVQIRGKEIEEKLNKIIDEVENARVVHKEGDPRSRQMSAAKGHKPASKSKLPPPVKGSVINRDDASKNQVVRSDNANWYKLPDAKRDQVIQSWGSEMPLRWKSRISAYFISVADAETQEKPKK